MILGLLRIIVWVLIFYVVYRIAASVMRIFTENKKKSDVQGSSKSNKYKIDKKDIIDAEFEDIANENKNKSNE